MADASPSTGEGTMMMDSTNKNANLHGLAFRLTLFLVARGGIEPPTQGFSIFAPRLPLLHRFAALRFC